MGVAWPHFQANELRDLFAYVRQEGGRSGSEMPVPAADPDRGWQVFFPMRDSCFSSIPEASG